MGVQWRATGPERTTMTSYVLLMESPEHADFEPLISCNFSSINHRTYGKNIPKASEPDTSTIIRTPKKSPGEPECSGCDVW